LDSKLASLLEDTTDLLVKLVEAGGTDAGLEAGIPALFVRYRPDEVIEERPVEPVVQESVESGQFVRIPLEKVDELVRMVSELFVHRSTFEKTLGKFGHEVGELSGCSDWGTRFRKSRRWYRPGCRRVAGMWLRASLMRWNLTGIRSCIRIRGI
jgi:hypothetical protein